MPNCSCSTAPADRLVGDPVDTLTGAVFDRRLEFRLIGPLELRCYRHYDSSQSHRRFALGWGQTHDFDRVLRFDQEGITYEAPVGRVFRFPTLSNEGDQSARHGFVLRRLSVRKYMLFHHGEPAMEFEFHQSERSARLKRLFQGPQQILFRYNASRQLERIVDSRGRRIHVVEEAGGRLISLTLEGAKGKPDVLLVAYKYDERGNLVSTMNGSGYGYAFAYDEANRMVLQRGRKGFRFYFAYDRQGRCISSTGDERLYGVSINYRFPRRVTKVTRADGGVWTYLFDRTGGLTQILDPLGGIQKFLRDETGKVIVEIDQNQNMTRIAYDEAGEPIAKVTSLGHRLPLPEDPNSKNPRLHRVPSNPVEYEYGRLFGKEPILSPSPALRMLPLSAQAKRLIFVRDERSETLMGDSKIEVRPLGVLWWPSPKVGRIFNDFGKLVEQRDEFGRVRLWTYDQSGNLSEYVDFDGGKWSLDYGSWHLLRQLTNPLGTQVRFSYTSSGRGASFVDAGGTRTEYRYDLNDNLIEVKRNGAIRDTYVRDACGNLLAKYASDGRELLRFEIGPGHLPVKRILAPGDEHLLEYDKSGRYLVAATKRCTVEFAYDKRGNRVLEKRNGQGITHRFQSRYRPAESDYFGRFTIHFHRSKNGTLVISDPGGKSQWIRLYSHGLVERGLSNGTRETAQYDALGRCLFKCVERSAGSVWSRRYHWSGEGELHRIEDQVWGEVRHEYDAAHRLVRRFVGGVVEEYRIDLADNLLQQPGLSDVTLLEGNRIGSANGITFDYNDRNHVETRRTPEGAVRYIYDSRDQLVRVQTTDGVWKAEYDALGRRTKKTWAGQTVEYYWNTDQLVGEVHSNGRVRIYVYADPLALTPFLFLDYDLVDAPPESCRRYFVFTDQIGTPCSIEDESGNEIWRAHIEPFGRAQIASGAKIEFNLRFPGHYFDPEINMQYNRFRYYDPSLGRYLQSDPWGIAGGFNLYAYRLNPLLQVDVRGLGEDGTEDCDDPNESGEDAENQWDATRLAVAQPEEPEEEPIPWDQFVDPEDVQESRDQYLKAAAAADDLNAYTPSTDQERENPGVKTAVAAGDKMYASGSDPSPGFDQVPPNAVKAALDPESDPNNSTLFPPAQQNPRDPQPESFDHDDPGSYHASHGDVQAAADQPGEPMGISRPICPNCANALSQSSQDSGSPVVATDPNGTHIFLPNGGYIGPNDDPANLGPVQR
jgi:RHS repeat-associated protein